MNMKTKTKAISITVSLLLLSGMFACQAYDWAENMEKKVDSIQDRGSLIAVDTFFNPGGDTLEVRTYGKIKRMNARSLRNDKSRADSTAQRND